MITLKSFFRSWYGTLWIILLLAAISSCMVTFYTTEESLFSSITMKKHGLIFLFSLVLMLLAIVPVAFVIYKLDSYKFLGQNEIIRYLIQFALLVLVLGAVALRIVYKVYLVVFGQDLQKGDYFERDFVVVMFCFIMVQFYYAFRKERKINNYKKKRVKVMQKWLLQKDEQIRAEEKKSNELRRHYEHELNELRNRKQRLRANHDRLSSDENRLKACLKEATEQVEVMIGAINEWVRIPQIAYFHLKEGSAKSKLVDVRLLDGREGTVDIDSLAKIEKLWPNLFFRAGRGLLIQQLAIKDQYKEGNDYIVQLLGIDQEQLKVPAEAYDRLLKIREEWALVNER
jgi:Bacterial cell division membrane protein